MPELRFYEHRLKTLEEVLPEILSKAYERGMRAVVLANDDERVKQLNASLWTYNPNSFLPHGSKDDGFAADQPIWLTSQDNDRPNGATLLVITNPARIDQAKDYDLCCIMVDAQDMEAVTLAQDQSASARSNGRTVQYWVQGASGKWEKSA